MDQSVIRGSLFSYRAAEWMSLPASFLAQGVPAAMTVMRQHLVQNEMLGMRQR
jgi:hypothetical protein